MISVFAASSLLAHAHCQEMRILLVLLALCACLLAGVQGSAFSKPVPEHPQQPGKCDYEGLAIAVGRSVTQRSSCTKLTCHKRDADDEGKSTYSVVGLGCNHASSWPDNCFLETPDLTKNFPDCCPQLQCDGPPEGGISLVG